MQIPGEHWVQRGRLGRLPRLGTTLLLILLLGSWSMTAVWALPNQQGSATVAVVPADIAKTAGETFEVEIAVSQVKDLGAFELSLRYDAALVQIDKVTVGEFIGSTDRTVLPLGPNINVAAGFLTVGALTTGASPGAQGQGVLLTLSCTAMRAGEGALKLEAVRLSDTQGRAMAATTTDGNVKFVGAVVVPTATRAPVTPTATLVPLPATATLIPTATTVPPSPSAAATATQAPTETPVPASATPAETPEPLETRILKVASATVQAWQTAAALWTATPTATATADPGAATPVSSQVAPAVTPAAPNASPSSSGAGLAVGLSAAAVALGAGGVYLWRRGRLKKS